jgi:signal transduction histidine kinase
MAMRAMCAVAMKIATQGRIVTATSLATIALIASMVAWAQREVLDADLQRVRAAEITRAVSDLRLVTFEYIMHRPERARQQELAAAAHLERLLTNGPFSHSEPSDVLRPLRERARTTRRLFAELVAHPDGGGLPDAAVFERFEAQLTNRLLLNYQESTADAFALMDYTRARIEEAQQRLMGVLVAGLGLVTLTTGAAAWLIHRRVLTPIRRFQEGTREVAMGNLAFRLDIDRPDEIGDMARNFDAMTDALRESFAQIDRSNHELTVLNKEIEAFSYSVSHDLRAPLRSMDGFSLALLEDYGDKLDDEGRNNLVRIRNASQRMGRLIDELLGLARVTRTELKLGPVDLSAMAREIAESLQQRQPDRAVQWDIEDGMVVHADRALMHIALQNLLENAWKFTAKTDAPVIRVGCVEQDGARTCYVADNGAGFDMNYADRLFGAFQRMHHESEFPGTGIGLAIVQRIVHRHEGSIRAHSEPGHGATFYFKLRESTDERHEQGHPAGRGQPG